MIHTQDVDLENKQWKGCSSKKTKKVELTSTLQSIHANYGIFDRFLLDDICFVYLGSKALDA